MIGLEESHERRAGMAKAKILNIVATECPPEMDARFNKWYNEVHIPMLMKYKGIRKVTRYKTVEAPGAKPKYLAVYEYDSQEALSGQFASPAFQAVREEMEQTRKTLTFELKWALSCEPIKTWEQK
jgi:uncharacterized protein (TIGR02118 family)